MKTKNIIVLMSSISLLGLLYPISEVRASEENITVQATYSNEYEVIEVSKEQIITDYSQLHNVSYDEAANILFPVAPKTNGVQFRSVPDKENISYVMLRAATQYTTLTQNIPNAGGQVYFYCEVSTSGWFRGIKRIIYAGYNAGSNVFNGQFQYHLSDPNRIHYTLNGGLYSNTTYTVSGGGSIGVGETANMNVSISATSNFIQGLYHHGDLRY